jgi:microcystin-dependent protein
MEENGQTTFALPNLCGRVPIHQGQGPGLSYRQLGESSGQENVTLNSTQMPMHNHLVSANATATSESPSGNFPAAAFVDATGDTVKGYAATGGASLAPTTVGVAGGNQPHENMQPFLTLNYCIALEGIFPSRN